MKNIKITIPKSIPWLDYSALSMFQRCPMSFYWRMVQHITPAITEASLINGQAYHEAKAVYLQAMIDKKFHEDAKQAALDSMIPIMQTITQDDPKRNLTVAIKTMDHYLDFWKDDLYKPIDVEIGFAVDLIDFFFVGRIDSFESGPFGKVVMETKTTTIVGDRWQFRGKPNLQIDGYVASRYILTGEMPYGAVLDVIPIHDKKIILPFRIITPRSVEDVENWIKEVRMWYFLINACKRENHFPPHTEMCMPMVGFSCNYRLLCKTYPSPFHLPEIPLSGEYKVESWAPFDFNVEEKEISK